MPAFHLGLHCLPKNLFSKMKNVNDSLFIINMYGNIVLIEQQTHKFKLVCYNLFQV